MLHNWEGKDKNNVVNSFILEVFELCSNTSQEDNSATNSVTSSLQME